LATGGGDRAAAFRAGLFVLVSVFTFFRSGVLCMATVPAPAVSVSVSVKADTKGIHRRFNPFFGET
jgi:hypothetical protein